MAKGVFPETHPYFAGIMDVACNKVVKEFIDRADLKMSDASISGVKNTFDAWVRGRHDRPPGEGDPAKPYPAFIISAEGGGIYAAAAASLFLAKLQDDCPGFAQHVFAISGVSGGAIGATVFQAHIPPSEQKDRVKCTARTDDGPLDHGHAEQPEPEAAGTVRHCP